MDDHQDMEGFGMPQIPDEVLEACECLVACKHVILQDQVYAPVTLARIEACIKSLEKKYRLDPHKMMSGTPHELGGCQLIAEQTKHKKTPNDRGCIMKCITICQPWVYAILDLIDSPTGGKWVENRDWYCRYRGPLLIHAGMSRKWFTGYPYFRDGTPEPDPKDCTFGAICGVANVVACVRPDDEMVKDHGYTEGKWCIVLADRYKFEAPIPYRGQLGLFNVPDDLVAEQMGGWRPASC